MSGKTTDEHRAGVERLVASGARPRGLPRVLKLACGIEMHPDRRLIPDAFKVSKSKRWITLYEVVVTHPVDEAKLVRCRALRDQLVAIGWTLRLFCNEPTEAPIELDIDGSIYDSIHNERMRRFVKLLGRPT